MTDSDHRDFPGCSSARLLWAGALALTLTGCGSDDHGDPVVERQAIIPFAGQINGQDFVCGQTYSGVGVGQPGTYQVNDWRFYVHDVELMQADGSRQPLDLDQDGTWQYQHVALLDLRQDCGSGPLPGNTVVKGAAPNADYTGVCFKVGVPYGLNHVNDATAPSPLNNSGMMWSWQSGHKFLRIDGVGDPQGVRQAFVVHVGSTQCPGSDPSAPPVGPCAYPNVAEFCLNDFQLGQDTVMMDMGQALAASNVALNTPDTASGCMSGNSDPECIAILPRLNLDFTYIAGAGAVPESYPRVAPQVLFSVRKP